MVLAFAKSLIVGYKYAYKAVINPTEGTMLTVLRESAENMLIHTDGRATVYDFILNAVSEMRTSLERTPEKLSVSKEAGVVDSGGSRYPFDF